MAIPDPSKAGSPFSPLQTGGWNPETPEINNFFIPLFSFRRGYRLRRADEGTTCGQLPAPVTCSENVVRSRRGLRRSTRNRAGKRSRLENRNVLYLNFRPIFEVSNPASPLKDFSLGKPERTGSMSKPPDKPCLWRGERRARALRAAGLNGRFCRGTLLGYHSPHAVAKFHFANRPTTS